jgi:cytochrome P450
MITTIIFKVYFHPLAKYPGPLLGKFTSLPKMMAMFRMNRVEWQTDMLKKYGDPVRISTNELIFGSFKSWQDIYGQSSNPCTKEPFFYDKFTVTGANSILNETDRTQHARIRRLVSQAFSERGLLHDEAVIQERVNLYVNTVIAPAAKRGESVDIYNKTMDHYLDIVSYLSFGKSFDSLQGTGEVTHDDLDCL